MFWKLVMWGLAWAMVLHLGITLLPPLGRLPLVPRISLLVGCTAFLLLAIYSPIVRAWDAEKAALMEGELVSYTALEGAKPGYNVIQIGRSGSRFEFKIDTPFVMAGDKITFRAKEGRLLFSTTVRDRQGNLILEVTEQVESSALLLG